MYEVNQSTQFIYCKQNSKVSSLLYLTATRLQYESWKEPITSAPGLGNPSGCRYWKGFLIHVHMYRVWSLRIVRDAFNSSIPYLGRKLFHASDWTAAQLNCPAKYKPRSQVFLPLGTRLNRMLTPSST